MYGQKLSFLSVFVKLAGPQLMRYQRSRLSSHPAEQVPLYREDLGDKLCAAIASAEESFICAPFIKIDALKALLFDFNGNLVVATRANPVDFASGVSDLDAWTYVWKMGGEVLIVPKLHAKYYRFDGRIFVGSANCTLAGLQGKSIANVELLAEFEPSSDAKDFEHFIQENGITATPEDYETLKREIESLKSNPEFKSVRKLMRREEVRCRLLSEESAWIPSCSEPSRAYWRAYCGDAGTGPAATADLERLCLPEGSSTEDEFRELLGVRIAQMSFTAKIERLFANNTYAERPYLSWGTIRRESGIEWSRDRAACSDEVNGVMDLLCYALPQVFFEPEPMTYSRLLGKIETNAR